MVVRFLGFWGIGKRHHSSLSKACTKRSVWGNAPALSTLPFLLAVTLSLCPPPEGEKFIHSWWALSVFYTDTATCVFSFVSFLT